MSVEFEALFWAERVEGCNTVQFFQHCSRLNVRQQRATMGNAAEPCSPNLFLEVLRGRKSHEAEFVDEKGIWLFSIGSDMSFGRPIGVLTFSQESCIRIGTALADTHSDVLDFILSVAESFTAKSFVCGSDATRAALVNFKRGNLSGVPLDLVFSCFNCHKDSEIALSSDGADQINRKPYALLSRSFPI